MPDMLGRFMKPVPGGQVEDVHVDATVGGELGLTMVIGDSRVVIKGAFRRVERFTLLEFSWLSHRTTETSIVTLHFEALERERTRLTLEHGGFPDASARDDHDAGWSQILFALQQILR